MSRSSNRGPALFRRPRCRARLVKQASPSDGSEFPHGGAAAQAGAGARAKDEGEGWGRRMRIEGKGGLG
eukprot:scaffold21489_cov67-Phaeocystis_antarctica.AAC.1